MISWHMLNVTDSDGNCQRLADLLAGSDAWRLQSATLHDGKISEWNQHFLSVDGEEPDWDTPRVPIDWRGFRDAYRQVFCVCGQFISEDSGAARLCRTCLTAELDRNIDQ